MRFGSVVASVRRHGACATVRTAWKRRRKGARRRIVLFGLTRPGRLPDPGGAPACSYRFASPEEAEEWGGMAPGVAGRILGQEDRCLLQFDQDRLVGYVWVSVLPVVFVTEGFHLPLPEDAAYVYKTFTLPEHRGADLQPRRTLELYRRLAEEGRRRLICYVDDTNLDSMKGVRKAGYEPIGEVRFRLRGRRVRASVRLDREWWSDVRRV